MHYARGLHLAIALILSAAGSLTIAVDDAWLTMTSDKEDAVYAAKAKATFTLVAVGNTPPNAKLSYKIHWDHGKDLAQGDVTLKAGKAELSQVLPEPGCLVVEVTLGTLKAEYGAVADPFKIMPSQPAPKDLDAFWDAEKKALAKVPMNARLVPAIDDHTARYGPEVECFDLTLDCTGGKPVHGYYVRPKGAKPKSLPAYLSLPSGGIKDSSLHAAWYQAKSNQIALDINAHALLNGQPADYYTQQNKELSDYQARGIESRDSFYFKGMYLRTLRAIDFLASQPEWDGKILIASGGSQGGGLSLVAGGLDARVSEIIIHAPGFCEFSDLLGRQRGWPGKNAVTPQAKAAVSYFDVCYLAPHFKGKATCVTGLLDTTCPPIGVLAAFNQLGGERSLVILPAAGHSGDQKIEKDPKFKHLP